MPNLPVGTQNSINKVIDAQYKPAIGLINIQKIYSVINDESIKNYFVTDITTTPQKTLFDNYIDASEKLACDTIKSIKLYNFNLPSMTTIFNSGFTCSSEITQIRTLVNDPNVCSNS